MVGGLGRNPYEEKEPPEKEPPAVPTREEFWRAYPGEPYPPVAERPEPELELPIDPFTRISPQGKIYTVRDEVGKEHELHIFEDYEFIGTAPTLRSPNYNVYEKDKKVGVLDYKTGEFIPEDPKWWQTALKWTFAAPTITGMGIRQTLLAPELDEEGKERVEARTKAIMEEFDYPYGTAKELALGEVGKAEYEALPWWQQLLWELPFWAGLAVSGVSALKGFRAARALPTVARVPTQIVLAPMAGYEKAVAIGLKYGVGVPLKGISIASRKAFEKALDLGLDKWLVRQGIRGDQANKVVQYFLKVNNRWLYQQAETSVKKSLAKRIAVTQAGRVAANDVVKAAEPMLRDAVKSVTGKELVPITPVVVKPLVAPPVKPPIVPEVPVPDLSKLSDQQLQQAIARDLTELQPRRPTDLPKAPKEVIDKVEEAYRHIQAGNRELAERVYAEALALPKPPAVEVAPEVTIGDTISDGLVSGKVVGEGIIGKNIPAYRIELPDGKTDLIIKDQVTKVTPAIPKVEVTPEVAKPPTGIKYVFNLKKFRFEPQAVELAPGISSEADKLTNLVKLAKPVRELTEALKHEELSKRVGAAAATAKATGAQKAAFAAMAKLKGELPTATFTPPEAGLTKGEIAALYNQVKSKLLVGDQKFFKWLDTDAALRKLLAGNIPTRGEIELLEGMFGSELAGAILAKRPLNEKIWEATVDILNIPRAILASFDFSAWLRQGAFIVTGYPPIGAKALAIDLRTFFSGKYTAEIDTAIHAGKFAQLREDAGLYLAPVEEGVAVKLAAREETFMSRLVKKIPIVGIGVRLSERAYLSTLNYMRASTFDYYAAKWEKMDYPMKTYKQLATLINWSTGRGPIGKLGNMVPVINSVFFAARLQTSRIGMLFAGPAKFTSPPVRRAYIRMMLAFFGSMSAIVALLELTDVATTNTDPRSTDFGKIRIGNTRLDPWAGFRPIITVLAQTITGQRKTATERIQDVSRQETLLRFLRSKYAPAMGLITDILKGETYLGEEMTLETESLREQFYQRLTPLFIQDMIDSINEDGWMGGAVASPGVLGVGVVTYPGSIDAYERHVVDIPEDMLQDWQRGIVLSGEPLTYQNLNVVQKSWLIRHCEAIGDIPERKEPGQFNFYEAERETREELETKLNEEIEPVITGLLQGEITIADYITQSDHLRNKYFGTAAYMWRDSMREKLDPLLHKNLEKWHEEEIKPSDKAYEEYMDIRTNPPTKAGVPDWDAWADILKGFLSQQTTEIRDYIEARRQSWIDNLPPERQRIERLIVICEEVLDDYYAQPEGKDRVTYREQNPDVDVKLNLLGRITTVRSNSALVGLAQWANEWGIPYSSIPALAEGPPEAPPREEGLGPSPYE